MTHKDLPPGPTGKFLVGNSLAFSEDPLNFLLRCSREFGDLVRISSRTYLVNHPELAGQVLHDRDGTYAKRDPDLRSENHSAFPDSVMSSVGADWQHKRTVLQAAFHKDAVRDHVASTAALALALADSWCQAPGERDMRREMQQLCLTAASHYLMDATIDGQGMDRIMHVVDAIMTLTRSQIRFPGFIPTPGNLRLRRARRDLDQTLGQLVERFRHASSGRRCLLGILLDSDATGQSGWLRDEVATMLMSGLEPLADGLTWTLYLLARHPDILQQLREEIDAILPPDGQVGASDLPQLRLVDAVVKEALRLYPPAWLTGRIALRSATLGGFKVPAGTTLLVSAWVSHRDARHFPEPETFRPARWLDDHQAQKAPTLAYLPFGSGARKCIGEYLARTQMVTVVASLCRRMDLQLAPGATPRPYPALVLRPLGVQMSVAPRGTAPSPGTPGPATRLPSAL